MKRFAPGIFESILKLKAKSLGRNVAKRSVNSTGFRAQWQYHLLVISTRLYFDPPKATESPICVYVCAYDGKRTSRPWVPCLRPLVALVCFSKCHPTHPTSCASSTSDCGLSFVVIKRSQTMMCVTFVPLTFHSRFYWDHNWL